MLAYVEGVQRQERARGVETLTHQQWSGAALVDAQLSTLDSMSSTLAMGSGVTESQFDTGDGNSPGSSSASTDTDNLTVQAA